MEFWDLAGHMSHTILAVGTWMIGNKNKWGFALYFVANIAWIVIGWGIGMTSIWVWELVFLYFAWRNFRKWGEDDDRECVG